MEYATEAAGPGPYAPHSCATTGDAGAAAARLDAYHSKLGTEGEIDYPEGHDPSDDARIVKNALGG